jgi:hypothetical protein
MCWGCVIVCAGVHSASSLRARMPRCRARMHARGLFPRTHKPT